MTWIFVWCRFDYAGIAILIVSSFYPPVFYGFQCHQIWRNAHLAVITAFGELRTNLTNLPALSSILQSFVEEFKERDGLSFSSSIPIVRYLLFTVSRGFIQFNYCNLISADFEYYLLKLTWGKQSAYYCAAPVLSTWALGCRFSPVSSELGMSCILPSLGLCQCMFFSGQS